MTPIVRYFVICDDVRIDVERNYCAHVDCLRSSIISEDNPPYPYYHAVLCIYLVFTACHGSGAAQIRAYFMDTEPEELAFASPEQALDFVGHSPLESLGVTFRIETCPFPRPGRYSIQFWYNQECLAECPLQLR